MSRQSNPTANVTTSLISTPLAAATPETHQTAKSVPCPRILGSVAPCRHQMRCPPERRAAKEFRSRSESSSLFHTNRGRRLFHPGEVRRGCPKGPEDFLPLAHRPPVGFHVR